MMLIIEHPSIGVQALMLPAYTEQVTGISLGRLIVQIAAADFRPFTKYCRSHFLGCVIRQVLK